MIYAYSPRGRKKREVYVGDEDGFFLKATEKILGIGNYSSQVRKYMSRYSDEERGREEYEVGKGMEIIYEVIKYTRRDLPELVEASKNIRRKTVSMLHRQRPKQSKIPWPYIFSIGAGAGTSLVVQYFGGADVYLGLVAFLSASELVQYAFHKRKHRQMVNELKKILEEENIPLEIHKFKVTNDYYLCPYKHEILLKLGSKK